MRRPDVLDPAVAADLAALDAALDGSPDADPSLTLFAAGVRSAAPRPAPAFRARLDDRVERGFPRPSRRPGLWRRVLLPAAPAVAAIAALVLVVAIAPRSGELDGGGSSGASSVGAGKVAAPSAAGGGGDAAAPATAGGGGDAVRALGGSKGDVESGGDEQRLSGAGSVAPLPPTQPAPGRRVERDVRLDLRAPASKFTDVSDDIVRTTQRAGGYVATSQISSAQAGGTATFVLQIPSERLDTAVAALSRLGHVTNLQQSTQDVTDTFDSLQRQIGDARIQRRALVAELATASGTRAVRLRARLDRVSARLRLLLQQRRDLAGRTTYGTVELSLTATRRDGAAAAAPGGRWTPGDAWHDAKRVLEVAAGVLIVALTILVPLALIGSAVAAGAQAVRRRRREAALAEA